MLRSMSDLEGYAIRATDGPIGEVTDFYFDDTAWVIRYLVVDTGRWLSSRKVLISPISIEKSNRAERTFPVSITREQVKNSPSVDTDKPVSRQHEMQHLTYYGYPFYWGGAGFWGPGIYPSMKAMGISYAGAASEYQTAPASQAQLAREAKQHENDDAHLRSGEAVMKYHIEASDGGIGHVQGLLIDEETWAIRYLIVDTSNWWLGHQVLIAPQWIKHVSWPDHTVSVSLTRQAVKDAPPYSSAMTLDRDREIGLHKHYERIGYWADEVNLGNAQHRAVKSAPQGAIHKNV